MMLGATFISSEFINIEFIDVDNEIARGLAGLVLAIMYLIIPALASMILYKKTQYKSYSILLAVINLIVSIFILFAVYIFLGPVRF